VDNAFVTYTYELRRGPKVASTGTLLLEQAPHVGETLRVGGELVEVEDVTPSLDGAIRLVLRSFAV
jgi:hypothetical protein